DVLPAPRAAPGMCCQGVISDLPLQSLLNSAPWVAWGFANWTPYATVRPPSGQPGGATTGTAPWLAVRRGRSVRFLRSGVVGHVQASRRSPPGGARPTLEGGSAVPHPSAVCRPPRTSRE